MKKAIVLAFSLVVLSNCMTAEPTTDDEVAPTPEPQPAQVPNPASVHCVKLGHSLSNGECVFPDGTRCPDWHFYRGKCGQEWSYCAKRGGRLENRIEDMGTWTASYGVCVFEDRTECLEPDLFDGSCDRGSCQRWTLSGKCEPSGSSPTSMTELPGNWKKVPNAAHYKKADWSHLLYRTKNGTAGSCAKTCGEDPSCTFFFINERGTLVLETLGDRGVFDYKECVFFSGEFWAGFAPQSDTYVKSSPEADLPAP